MYRNKMYENEAIYIAGPECFYTGGCDMLAAMRVRAESLGFMVTLPNSHPLDMENPVLKKRADCIFEDLKEDMNASTVIIADLEAYRGSEPDSGTIYEIGMAYARGIRCYGYTRDKRSLVWKDQKYVMRDGAVYEEHGNPAPYAMLPFSPNVMGSTKIVEGDFDDCLRSLTTDLEEEIKHSVRSRMTPKGNGDQREPLKKEQEKPLVFLSGPERYLPDADKRYQIMKDLCRKYGMDAVTPLDWAKGVEKKGWDNPLVKAANLFDNWQQHIKNCHMVIACLNDFRGHECCNDTAFECGMAFQLGKKLVGYMDNTGPMIERIPHLGESGGYRDQTGANVENFDYPANLMFSCSMEIFEGRFEEIVSRAAKQL